MSGRNRSPDLPAVGCNVTHPQHTTTDPQDAVHLPTPRNRRQWRHFWQHFTAAEDQVRQAAFHTPSQPTPARPKAAPAPAPPAYIPFITPAFLAKYSPEVQEWMLQLDHEDHVQHLLAQRPPPRPVRRKFRWRSFFPFLLFMIFQLLSIAVPPAMATPAQDFDPWDNWTPFKARPLRAQTGSRLV